MLLLVDDNIVSRLKELFERTFSSFKFKKTVTSDQGHPLQKSSRICDRLVIDFELSLGLYVKITYMYILTPLENTV